MGTGVGPEKGGEEKAKPSGGDAQFILKERCGDREAAAVDVVDENGEAEKDEDGDETSRDAGLR